MARRKPYEVLFDTWYTDYGFRFNQLGPIRLNDFWHMCRHEYNYSFLSRAYQEVMRGMKEQKKVVPGAVKGQWLIVKPADRTPIPKGKMVIHWGKSKRVVVKAVLGIWEAQVVDEYYPTCILIPKITEREY